MSGTWAEKIEKAGCWSSSGFLFSMWFLLTIFPYVVVRLPGFLMWWLRAPRASIPRETSKSFMSFCCNLALEFGQLHLHCVLFMEAVTQALPSSREIFIGSTWSWLGLGEPEMASTALGTGLCYSLAGVRNLSPLPRRALHGASWTSSQFLLEHLIQRAGQSL